MKTRMNKKGMETYIVGIIIAIILLITMLALFSDQSSGIIEFFKRLR